MDILRSEFEVPLIAGCSHSFQLVYGECEDLKVTLPLGKSLFILVIY